MTQTAEAIRPAYRTAHPGPIATLVGTVRDVISRRQLIGYLVRADLKKRGANTVLGNLWWVIDPLLTMVVYVILVSVIFRSSIEAYPLFIFCAILPWKWFSASVLDAITSITGKERVIKQVHFPKIVLPLAVCVAAVANFTFGLVPLGAMLVLIYPNHITPWLLALPLVAAAQFPLTIGLAIIASGATVFYRDIGNLAGHLLRIWFYLSPALYGSDQIAKLAENHPQLFAIYNLNPFAALFESYRNVIYYGQPPTWGLLALVVGESAVLVVVAVLVFRRMEPSFAKLI